MKKEDVDKINNIKEEDFIGKEFIGVKFKDTKLLMYGKDHESSIGEIGKVDSLHTSNKDYVLIRFNNGRTKYYPTLVVLEQIEQIEQKQKECEQNPEYLNNLFKEVFNLIR
jgi:hypothetical protein